MSKKKGISLKDQAKRARESLKSGEFGSLEEVRKYLRSDDDEIKSQNPEGSSSIESQPE